MSSVDNISSKLWAMANELRGNMDAAEYKNYILAFMFYRYLSEHQEEYLTSNNIIDVAEGQTINQAYVEQASGEELDDYLEDISSSLGYAIAPQDTWFSLVEKIDNSLVVPSDYQTIFDNFNKYAALNRHAEKDFRGVFNDVNLGDSRLGTSTNDRAKSLNCIVKMIDGFNYKSDDGADILGDIYQYLIEKFAASAGKKGGEFYTPHAVSEILSKIVTLDKERTDSFFSVYDPTMGSGSLLLTVGKELPIDQPIKYYGQELNTTTYNLARMNLMMHGVAYQNMDLRNADTLGDDWPNGKDSKGIDDPICSFDAVVANPPYSAHWDNRETRMKDPRFHQYGKLAPRTKADYAFILHGLYHLGDEGTMAIVLPHGVLFRGAAEGVIRETIIKKNYLDAVIGLPANIFYGTGIPTIIMVLKKNRSDNGVKDVLFIDASREFEKAKNQNRLTVEHIDKIVETYKKRQDEERYAHVASREEIESNDFNLNIPRYVDTFEPEEEIDLAEVQKLIEQDDREIAELEAVIAEQLKILGV